MIVGAAVVPTAPLLLPAVSPRVPPEVTAVAEAVRGALRALPPHDVAVIVAAAQDDGDASIHAEADASLAGIGRPDLRLVALVDTAAVDAVTAATGCPQGRDGLPLGHRVLLHLRAPAAAPVVPVAVPIHGSPKALAVLGSGLAEALEGRRAALLVAGDLAAGVTERGPLGLVEGARAWDDAVVDGVARGRMDGLARLGPHDAARLGAVGWAPLVVLSAVLARARLATVVRCYAAPRGVGYVVASAG